VGLGVDNLEYDSSSHRLFIAAGKDGSLTIARLSEDSEHGRLLVVDPLAVVKGGP